MPGQEEAKRFHGTSAPPTPYRMLRAGALEARLEGGNLRYIRFDGIEMLRAVSYLIRDRDWGTLAPEISDLRIEEREVGFHVSYSGACANGDVRLTFHAEIEGSRDGHLRFDVEATPDRDFETSRCGFTVLHPIDGVAGAAVAVEHCDGTVEDTHFPELIAPWQPFKSIRALTHRPAPHVKATCRMEGDVFEMEDQRNWSDASYKTYVRPLALLWPYILPAGKTIRQSVGLSIEAGGPGANAAAVARSGEPVRIELGELSETRFPEVGLVIAPEEARNALVHAARLAEIAPQAILCHFDPTVGHGQQALLDFASLQGTYPARYELEYVVACDGDLEAEFETLRDNVRKAGLRLHSIAVCPSVDRQSTPPGSAWPACPPLGAVYRAARRSFPDIPLGGGMFSYFTELNRKRPPVALLDFVTHATNPIVHAADDESVMETLLTLPHITRSARAIISADKAYRLGPSTIGMRQNPYGSRTFDNPRGERLCMAAADPRQRGLFAAAWTVGYAARIAPARIERWVPAAFTGPARGAGRWDRRTASGGRDRGWPCGSGRGATGRMSCGRRKSAGGHRRPGQRWPRNAGCQSYAKGPPGGLRRSAQSVALRGAAASGSATECFAAFYTHCMSLFRVARAPAIGIGLGQYPMDNWNSSDADDGKIVRRKLSDQVLERLREMIVRGEVAPGDLMPSERDLMERFGVGRPAVREALQSMHTLGLITISHGERARVSELSADLMFRQMDIVARMLLSASPVNLEHLKEARRLFEVGMVRTATTKVQPSDIEALQRLVAEQRSRLGDPAAFIKADMAFHGKIASLSGNPIFAAVSDAMLTWLFNYHTDLLIWSGREDVTLGEHEKIIECIASGDPEHGAAAMRSHLDRSNDLYRHH